MSPVPPPEGLRIRPAAPAAGSGSAPVTDALVIADPWQQLRRYTDARIALGRAGASLPTGAHLAFQLAHARARDAVHHPLDVALLTAALRDAGALPPAGVVEPALVSAAGDRATYLQRPDLGRRLDDASRAALAAHRPADGSRRGLAIVIADGLSALAVERQAAPVLAAALPRLAADGVTFAPLVIVAQGRVAIGDEIGDALGAECVVVLIGERPGLSSPDSMGLYLTWHPRAGLDDASRNCISNVRPAGLQADAAAAKLAYLVGEARRRGVSGVALKDESTAAELAGAGRPQDNFLLASPSAAVTGPAAGS